MSEHEVRANGVEIKNNKKTINDIKTIAYIYCYRMLLTCHNVKKKHTVLMRIYFLRLFRFPLFTDNGITSKFRNFVKEFSKISSRISVLVCF